MLGGVDPHRHDLSSMVMLKDNHIWATGELQTVQYDLTHPCPHFCTENASRHHRTIPVAPMLFDLIAIELSPPA